MEGNQDHPGVQLQPAVMLLMLACTAEKAGLKEAKQQDRLWIIQNLLTQAGSDLPRKTAGLLLNDPSENSKISAVENLYLPAIKIYIYLHLPSKSRPSRWCSQRNNTLKKLNFALN